MRAKEIREMTSEDLVVKCKELRRIIQLEVPTFIRSTN